MLYGHCLPGHQKVHDQESVLGPLVLLPVEFGPSDLSRKLSIGGLNQFGTLCLG